MAKRKSSSKMAVFLPLLLLGIIAVSQGAYRSGAGGAGFLYLQPTLPQFRPAGGVQASFAYAQPVQAAIPAGGGIGSVSFGYASPIQPTYGGGGGIGAIQLSGYSPVQPTYGPSAGFGDIRISGAAPIAHTYGAGASLIKFGTAVRYASPVFYDYIYTTPSRTLFRTDVGYSYSNVAYIDP